MNDILKFVLSIVLPFGFVVLYFIGGGILLNLGIPIVCIVPVVLVLLLVLVLVELKL